VNAYVSRARAYRAKGEEKRAADDYLRARELDPGLPPTLQ
jgi:Tfp pilus assembly protein PilF